MLKSAVLIPLVARAASPWRRGILRPASMALALLLAANLACRRDADASAKVRNAPLFTEVTDLWGIQVKHEPYSERSYYMPELMGPGVTLFDFDNDGDLDLYLPNSAYLSKKERKDAEPPRNRLLEQIAVGRFRDVTETSGLGDTGFGMGAVIGDIDNDGDFDVYLTNLGSDALYRNNGSGRFTNITRQAGIRNEGWACSAGFFDYDRDGFLDIYVANYLEVRKNVTCTDPSGREDFCHPDTYAGVTDVLYHNNGDGTFSDVTRSAGIGGVAGKGLGVMCHDFDGDGWIDVYVANDAQQNQLWRNRGDGTFEDVALMVGVGLDRFGRAEGSMGVAVGDIDGDGDADLFMTHIRDESNTLYRNSGDGFFEDATTACGLEAASLPFTGFGTALLDTEHDGDLDMVVVNGRVYRGTSPHRSNSMSAFWSDYSEPNQYLENTGNGKFVDASERAGSLCEWIEVSRGLAYGDLDRDGDLDLVVGNAKGRVRVFRNDAPKEGAWLVVRALDPAVKRDAYGATVTVIAGGHSYLRGIGTGGSFASSSEPLAHFGLPRNAPIERLVIRWPDGTRQEHRGLKPNRYIVVRKGSIDIEAR